MQELFGRVENEKYLGRCSVDFSSIHDYSYLRASLDLHVPRGLRCRRIYGRNYDIDASPAAD